MSAVAPQNLDAEESVLGAMLLSPKAIDDVLSVLEPAGMKKFYRTSHGLLYETIRAARIENVPADPITITARLHRNGRLDEIGGKVRVNELAALVPTTTNAAHYARLVSDEWARRCLLGALDETRAELAAGASAESAMSAAEHRLLDVRSAVELGRHSRVYSSADLVKDFAERVAAPPDPSAGIAVPFTFVPRMAPSRLYVLAGYTADGKTAVAIDFLRAACRGGARVGFITLEMSAADLTDRLVSSFGIPYREVMAKKFTPPWDERQREALDEIGKMRFEIVDDANADSASIARYTKVGGYQAVIVDHLHRFDWSDRRHLEREVRGLTNLARSAEIPVLLLAQLSRSRGDKPFPRPSLASLRETAVIEQEAWMVSFVYRLRDKDTGNPTDEAEWIVAKNRSGPLGISSLHFDGTRVRYLPVESDGRGAA